MTERAAGVSLIGALVVLIGGWVVLSSSSGAQAIDGASAWLDSPANADLALVFASLSPTLLTFGAIAVVAWLHAGARAAVRNHTSWYLAIGAVQLSVEVSWRLLEVAAPVDGADALTTVFWLGLWATAVMTVAYVIYAARRWSLDHASVATWAVTPLVFRVWIVGAYVLAALVWLWALVTIPWPGS